MENATRPPLVRPCPRLGHPIRFRYCLHADFERPCFKIFDCWWESFDIEAYLRDHLPAEVFAALREAGPRPRIAALIEAAEAAQRRMADDPSAEGGGDSNSQAGIGRTPG